VHGFTAEANQIEAIVDKAATKVDTIKALVDQLTITAPIASQIYQIPVAEGEVVTPGLPLLSLVDLRDRLELDYRSARSPRAHRRSRRCRWGQGVGPRPAALESLQTGRAVAL